MRGMNYTCFRYQTDGREGLRSWGSEGSLLRLYYVPVSVSSRCDSEETDCLPASHAGNYLHTVKQAGKQSAAAKLAHRYNLVCLQTYLT